MSNYSTTDNHYKIPCYIDDKGNIVNRDHEILECLNNQLESSKSFLRSNRTYHIAEVCRKILFGDDKNLGQIRQTWKIEINKLRRQEKEMIGNAANIRPNFEIRNPPTNTESADKAATYEELKDHWWYDRNVDRVFKEVVQEAASGLGYIFVWPKKDPNTRKWEITPQAKSYKEGFPYQIGPDNDIDKAYSFTVWCEMPLCEFEETFPEYVGEKADRSAPSYMSKRFAKAKETFTGILGMLRRGLTSKTDSISEPSFPMKDVFYTFTRDSTINRTGKTIKMGTLNTNGELGGHDSYDVPSYEPGKNSIEDCRLFPHRRLTIWTHGLILKDGAPKWISDCLPVADFRFERLPKEYMGVPVVNDGRSLEAAINRMVNSIVDRTHSRANFPIGIDSGLDKVVKERLEKGGIRALVGKALSLNFRMVQKPIQALFDKDLFEVQAHEFEIIKSLYELLDYVVGTNDYSNLQRKNQVPAADTQEALIQSLGVLSVDHERELSIGILKFGRIWLQFAPQVYTLKKRLLIGGAKLMDLRDIDYDPTSLVPKLNPTYDSKPYWKRLREHLERFSLFAKPGSLQERQSITNKLTLMQLLKIGVPISARMLYDTFVGDGQFDKIRAEWADEQKSNAILASKIRVEVQAIEQAAGSAETGGIMGQIVKALELQNTSNEGRTPTNNSNPRLEQKADEDGIPRSTMATN